MDSEKESIESILSQAGIKISLRCPRARESSSDVDIRPGAGSSNAQHAVEEDSDVQSVLKNRDFFTSLFTRHPLSAVTDIHDFYYFLLLRKISKIQEVVRNQNNLQLLICIACKADKIYKQLKGNAIIYIGGKNKNKNNNKNNNNNNDNNNNNINNKKEIFSKSQTDIDLKYAALDFVIKFQCGIRHDVFEYLCQECPSMIIERFDDLDGIFNESAKTAANKDLFKILFTSGHHLSFDPPNLKLIDSLWLQAVLDIWKKEYSKDNGHRQLIEQYTAELRRDAETRCKDLSIYNVYDIETAVKSLSSFLYEIKTYKSDVLSESETTVEKLKRQVLARKADIVQKVFVHLGAEDWRRSQGCMSKLLLLTHFDRNSVQYSYLSKKLESPEDKPYADMTDDEFFTLEYRKILSKLEADQDAKFLEILRDRTASDVYSRLVEHAALYISSNISKQNDGLAEDVEMMLVMLRLAYRDVSKTSQEQEIFCYNLSMFLCSLSEKLLRLFNFYLTKDKNFENATLGDLLNANRKKLADAFGVDHLRTLAYFLTGTPGIKLGRNYRNSLVHWSAGMEPGDMTPLLASSMLWLFTDILNSVVIYFGNIQQGERFSNG